MATELTEQIVEGKRLVEETFQRIAGEVNIHVSGFRWRDDFPGPHLSSLYFDVRDAREGGTIEFQLRQLEQGINPSNQDARASVENQIRSCLQDVRKRLG